MRRPSTEARSKKGDEMNMTRIGIALLKQQQEDARMEKTVPE